uniref:SRP54 domain-containing protein n=1 Tax=Trichuris muris TaxID=70415 RepID=A0A5S6QKP7_TRIMR
MIDYAAVYCKGGAVLWSQEQGLQNQNIQANVSAALRSTVIQGRGNVTQHHEADVTYHVALDNEFDLIFLVAHQAVSRPSYAQELLDAFRQEFRSRYDGTLRDSRGRLYLLGAQNVFRDMDRTFGALLQRFVSAGVRTAPRTMRTFEESEKSKKTLGAMFDSSSKAAPKRASLIPLKTGAAAAKGRLNAEPGAKGEVSQSSLQTMAKADDADIAKMRENFMRRMQAGKEKKPKVGEPKEKGKRVKENRCWDGVPGKEEAKQLDFSNPVTNGSGKVDDDALFASERQYVGMMKGDLEGISEGSSSDEGSQEVNDHDEEGSLRKRASSRGFFAAFQSLVGTKTLNEEALRVPLEKMKEHLIGKNVAAEVADKLCQSVGVKLEGRVVGQFSLITSVVKDAVRECLTQLLLPKQRINLLRDIMQAREQKHCYSVVFCGVNGVGKSTNLAKITFWLNENGFKVMIAACDTFRAGAVEQLRTHTRHLAALHPGYVQLYEQGYGKDAAAVAASAISHALNSQFDVVLIDTAGRMQDNEPLMRSLGKLIRVNSPDLVLFVGEALVGNEAVDQLQKFNQALADHSGTGEKGRLLDGIMLTKFDTIDDKVGAAVSMTYITGKPIVFVGTGQTYRDLKVLDPNVVVSALLK